MAKYATTDASGRLTGFYDDQISKVPSGAVALSDADYATWLSGQGAMVWTAGALVAAPVVSVAGPTLAAQAQAQLRTWGSKAAMLVAMGQAFSDAQKAYVTALQAIAAGTDTTSTALPAEPS